MAFIAATEQAHVGRSQCAMLRRLSGTSQTRGKDLIINGRFTGMPIFRPFDFVSQKTLETNAIWLAAIIKAWPSDASSSSNYFWGDVFLELDEISDFKLFEEAKKTQTAIKTALEMRQLISTLQQGLLGR